MLVTPLGEPVPPQSVVKRLAAVDPRLSIKWVPSAAARGGAYWGVIERWREDDPRWARVRSHELPETSAFDLRAMLPIDCSVDEADSFVARVFRPVSDAAKEAAQKVEQVVKHNADVKDRHVERFMLEQEEKTAKTTKHEYEVQLGIATAHPMVSGVGDGTLKKGRRKAK